MSEWQFRDASQPIGTPGAATYICRDFDEFRSRLGMMLKTKQMLTQNIVVYAPPDATPDELRNLKVVGLSVVGR